MLARLVQVPTVCVAVSVVVVVTVRVVPVPPSLQVSVPVKLLAVTVDEPQLSARDSVGAPGSALMVTDGLADDFPDPEPVLISTKLPPAILVLVVNRY